MISKLIPIDLSLLNRPRPDDPLYEEYGATDWEGSYGGGGGGGDNDGGEWVEKNGEWVY